ncbi:MAG TPA: regulatory protein RecX [Daejeonella sp.]|nr:regulatory protein RecX [Daejeonella sp.]
MDIQKPPSKIFSKEQALTKAESYCAYQERSQQEVRDKLYEWGLHQAETEEVIAELITQNFLNEERFALAYALGKFRMKGWGKMKIKQGLKLKKVPEKLIIKALAGIEEQDYLEKLSQLMEQKAQFLKEKDPFKFRLKLMQYLAAKGYEKDLILFLLKNNQLNTK